MNYAELWNSAGPENRSWLRPIFDDCKERLLDKEPIYRVMMRGKYDEYLQKLTEALDDYAAVMPDDPVFYVQRQQSA